MSGFSPGEYKEFEAGGKKFLYLVPSGGIFELDDLTNAILNEVKETPRVQPELVARLSSAGFAHTDVAEAIDEMHQSHLLRTPEGFQMPVQSPPTSFPLQTIVINLTNQCNLSCQYCYEFGEDKVATPDGKPKFMDWPTAQASVDHLFNESAGRKAIHITFFGGETLMNFPLLKKVVEYAQKKAGEEGRYVDFSLTTNATLLTDAIIEFLSSNSIGVTVSIDGPKEMNDALRVFANGMGSYDIMAPKVKKLLANHKTRPIAARVTLTAQVANVMKIFRHLTQDMGFHEVGFAPVTTSANRLYAIGTNGLDTVLAQFQALAKEYLEYALAGKQHAFSNVSDTLNELHAGISKSHPCGAGLGLVGVGPSGDISPATASSIPTNIRSATSRPVWTVRSRRLFSTAATSIRNTIATAAGRARCAPAAATMRPMYATAIRAMRICTTAIGSAAGQRLASKSTGQSRPRIRRFSNTLTGEKLYEASSSGK